MRERLRERKRESKVQKYMAKMRDANSMQFSNKDRLNFYPCVADAPLDVSDHACLCTESVHKFMLVNFADFHTKLFDE